MMWKKYNPPLEAGEVLTQSPKVNVISTTQELFALACDGQDNSFYEVAYDVPGKGRYVEATVTRVRNGLSVNYTEAYMRRLEPDCVFIGDDLPTDKERFHERFGRDFESVRAELQWITAEHWRKKSMRMKQRNCANS